jgi:hypothetical protein
MQPLSGARTLAQLQRALAQFCTWSSVLPDASKALLAPHLLALDFVPVLQRHMRCLTGCPNPQAGAPLPPPPALLPQSAAAAAAAAAAAVGVARCGQRPCSPPQAATDTTSGESEGSGVGQGGGSELPPAARHGGCGAGGSGAAAGASEDALGLGGAAGSLSQGSCEPSGEYEEHEARLDAARNIVLAWAQHFDCASVLDSPPCWAAHLRWMQQLLSDPAPLLWLVSEAGRGGASAASERLADRLVAMLLQALSLRLCGPVHAACVGETEEVRVQLTRVLNRQESLPPLLTMVRVGVGREGVCRGVRPHVFHPFECGQQDQLAHDVHTTVACRDPTACRCHTVAKWQLPCGEQCPPSCGADDDWIIAFVRLDTPACCVSQWFSQSAAWINVELNWSLELCGDAVRCVLGPRHAAATPTAPHL